MTRPSWTEWAAISGKEWDKVNASYEAPGVRGEERSGISRFVKKPRSLAVQERRFSL